MMTDTLKNQKFQKAVICAEGLIVTILALFAIHDTVTATGAGYLLFLKSGLLSRTVWDIMVDALVAVITFALILIPVRIYKAGITEAVIFYLAGVSLAMLVRPDILITSFTGREAVGVAASADALLSYLPLFCIAIVFTVMICFTSDEKESVKKYVWYAAFAAIFIASSVILSSFREIFVFAAGYTVLLPSVKKTGSLKEHVLPLSIVLFAASAWKLYFILATYHV